eukprot:g4580.t1
MELVVDLVEALGAMCRADNLPLESSFQCAIAAMRTLRGPGAALQMDDAEFILYVYKLLPRLVTGGHGGQRKGTGGVVSTQDKVMPLAMLALREAFVQCNAMGASLWEAVAMTSHYHPAVAASARGALTMGTLEPNFQDSNKILREFSTAAAGFNPGIRAPREHPQRKRERLLQKKAAKKERQKMERLAEMKKIKK